VLKHCSTEVAKGEVVVVCGPSGSGKSTPIKCVNGLEPFQEGAITVAGISVKSQPAGRQCHRYITIFGAAAVTQRLQLLHELVPSRRHPLGISARYAKKLLMSGGHHT
jgi:ABC-type polar amino acid transport system ATPase subunit